MTAKDKEENDLPGKQDIVSRCGLQALRSCTMKPIFGLCNIRDPRSWFWLQTTASGSLPNRLKTSCSLSLSRIWLFGFIFALLFGDFALSLCAT